MKKNRDVNNKGYMRAAALVLSLVLLCASLMPSVLAAPTDTTGKSSLQSTADPDSKATRETNKTADEDDNKTGEADKKEKNDKTDKTDEADKNDKNEEADATPEPSKNPRIGDDGKPIMDKNESALLIDARSGEVMFEQNANKRIYPASTTKIMTALLVLEAVERGDVNLNSAFLVTPDMLEGLAEDGSSMKLKEGEALTVRQLLEGLLVESGNDAAQALAIIVCGDVETFVQRMNDKAGELKLSDTHYVNPHGLHDDDHYTTAADLCTVTREAMKNKTFRDIVAMTQAVIPATEKSDTRTFTNTNGLISTLKYTNYFYENAIGVKTGHTSQAGFCLVSAAKEGDLEVIGAVMNAENEDDRHYDSRNMLSYAIDNFKAVTPVKKDEMLTEVKVRFGSGADHTTLSVAKDVTVTVPEDTEDGSIEVRTVVPDYIAAPVEEDEAVGKVEVVLDGKVIGSADLLADMRVKRHPLGFIMQFFAFLWSFLLVKIIVIALLAAFVIFVIYMIVNIRKNLKLASKRNRQRRRRR